jgi:thioredoxin-like negative regulator of GroEL
MKLLNDLSKQLSKMNKNYYVLMLVLFVVLYVLKPYLTNLTEGMENDGGKCFVLFHSPNCGHCVRAMPDFDKLIAAERINGIKIIKVNCLEETSLAEKHGVKSFPTYKLLNDLNDSNAIQEYDGARDFDSMMAFVKGN